MNVSAPCPFVRKFADVCLQNTVSFLTPKELLDLRVVCKRTSIFSDQNILPQVKRFPQHAVFVRRLACLEQPKLMLFTLPSGTNERMVRPRFASERINIIQAQAFLIIFR